MEQVAVVAKAQVTATKLHNWEATGLHRTLLREPSDMQGHLETLHSWVVRLRPEWVIELGVRKGNSTVALLAGLEFAGKGTLWSCDIKQPKVPGELWEHPQWRFALGDDLSDKLDPPPPSRCQLLFIDTSHDGEHTRRELELYGERVDPGGVILCHDVDTPDCGHAVREWSRDERNASTYCYGLSATLV